MSIESQLTKLLKNGISNINMGMNPQGAPYCQCEQVLATGGEGCITKIMHQRVATTLGACLEALADDIEYCAKLHKPVAKPSNLIQVPGAN